jgi:hypothetical protein
MANKTVEVRFSSDHEDYLALSVRGRSYRHQRDYWDGNWLLVTATIHVGKFSGEVPGMLRAEELITFSQKLHEFLLTLKGMVSFETAEEWLHFHIETDAHGKLEISGTLSDDVSFPYNSLKFTIPTNPRLLATPLQQLQTVTQTFPLVSRP